MALIKSQMLFAVIIIFACAVQSERIKDKMYVSLNGAFCFRRLTASGQHGCTTSFSGDTGVVHFVESSRDVEWIISKGDAAPYMVVTELSNFVRSDMLRLKNSKRVSGILLWNNNTLDSFSTEDTCPNRASGLVSEACTNTEAWNPVGSSMLFDDWDFPIVFVQNVTSIEFLREFFDKYNADLVDQSERSLCAVEIQSHMLAALNTQTCYRRTNQVKTFTYVKFCDPLGDYSVHLVADSNYVKNDDQKFVLVITRMDGSSLFDSLTPGAMSPITNIVTLLTASSYLKDMGAYTKPANLNLMLLLLNGEAFDYIGSSRVVYDMQNKLFPSKELPINLSNIGLIVELDQISGTDLFFYTRSNNSLVNNFVKTLQSGLKPINLNPATAKLPPASVQRFLLANADIPHIVITNYNSSYKNAYYNSMLDTAQSLGYEYSNGSASIGPLQHQIDSVAAALARSVYTIMHGEDIVPPSPKVALVDELLHCFLETMNCSFFYNVTNGTSLPDEPTSTYVGVFNNNNTITRLTGLSLAALTGVELPFNMTTCANLSTPGLEFIWMSNRCVQSSVKYYPAWSPAFEINDYNWTSNEYSSWTESVWRDLSMRVYLKPSFKQQTFNVTMGLLVLVLSFVAVYFVNAKSDILFSRVVLRSTGGTW